MLDPFPWWQGSSLSLSKILLGHDPFLRRLARALVTDASLAEDLVQDTILAALEHPPRRPGQARAWLARVLRNRHASIARSEARRRGRERAVARPERVPPAIALAEREELRRPVVEALLRLAEPCRTTVLLRYYDDLPPREIAREMGVPVETVRTRLKRGLAELREALGRSFGEDRCSWGLSLLAAFQGAPGAAGPISTRLLLTRSLFWGGMLMKNKALLVLLILPLLGVIWWALEETGPASKDPREVRSEAALEPAERSGGGRSSQEVEKSRSGAMDGGAAPGMVGAGEVPGEVPAEELRIHARVVDAEGYAVPAVTVCFQPQVGNQLFTTFGEADLDEADEAFTVVTDDEGFFTMTFPATPGRLAVDDERYVTLLDQMLSGELPQEEITIVVAPRCSYDGSILDEEGRPLAEVPVTIGIDLSLIRGLRPGVPRLLTPTWSTETDDAGVFELADVGWTEGITLIVRYTGYESAEEPLPDHSQSGLVIALRRVEGGLRAVAGQVVDAGGNPVADARVYLGERSTRSDHQGRFIFERQEEEAEEAEGRLMAVKRGFLPAVLELEAGVSAEAEGARERITLVLGGEPLEISGVVVDGAGDPVHLAHVWTHDGERIPGRKRGDQQRVLEELIGPGGDAVRSGRHQQTDEEGRFRLSGLLPRSYNLFAMHPRTLQVVTLGEVEAGRGEVELVLDGAEPTTRVAGRVVTYSGDPIAAVQILPGRKGSIGGRAHYAPLVLNPAPFTDDDGWFEFEALCVEGTYLIPAGPDISFDRFLLDTEMDLENLEIRIPAECMFQVILEEDPEEADSLMILDENDEFIYLKMTLDGSIITKGVLTLVGGRSEVASADERAATLVLRKAGKEVRRVPIELVPGEVQVIRP